MSDSPVDPTDSSSAPRSPIDGTADVDAARAGPAPTASDVEIPWICRWCRTCGCSRAPLDTPYVPVDAGERGTRSRSPPRWRRPDRWPRRLQRPAVLTSKPDAGGRGRGGTPPFTITSNRLLVSRRGTTTLTFTPGVRRVLHRCNVAKPGDGARVAIVISFNEADGEGRRPRTSGRRRYRSPSPDTAGLARHRRDLPVRQPRLGASWLQRRPPVPTVTGRSWRASSS